MSRSIVERYCEAQWPYRPDVLGELRHPDWFMVWPQSGERIRGHENDVAINQSYPDYPKHSLIGARGSDERWALSPSAVPVRVSGAGDLWFAEMLLEYPDQGRFYGGGIVELKEGKVFRDTWYWAPVMEPPEWRAELAERIDGPFGRDLPHGEGSDDEEAHRKLGERFIREAANDPAAAMRAAWAENVIEVIPQTGELIRGLDRAIAMVEKHPQRPALRGGRVTAVGDLIGLEVELDYGGDKWLAFEIGRVSDGKIVHITEYFGQPFEAAEWRAQWVEKS